MPEKRKQRARAEVLAPAGGIFDSDGSDASETPGLVTVSAGLHAEQLPVAEMTVGRIRERFATRFEIHPEAVALVDGAPAEHDQSVQTGQTLMFVRRSGEKGADSWTRF